MTPVKAIREKCIDCMCGQKHEVKLCPITDCSLYPFRLGKNPNRKGLGNKNASFLSKNANSANDSATQSMQGM